MISFFPPGSALANAPEKDFAFLFLFFLPLLLSSLFASLPTSIHGAGSHGAEEVGGMTKIEE